MILKIQYVVFYTNDMGRAVTFYRKFLGPECEGSDDRFTEFRVGDALFGIKMSTEPREAPGHQTVILECDDVKSIYGFCRGLDVPTAKELSVESWGVNFAVLDPDGNKVEFVQRQT